MLTDMPDCASSSKKPPPHIHPIDPDVAANTARPIVSIQDWFSSNPRSRLERYGPSVVSMKPHPALQCPSSSISDGKNTSSITSESRLLRSNSEPLLHQSNESQQDVLMQTTATDFARLRDPEYVHNEDNRARRNAQVKLSRSSSLSNAVHRAYRQLSSSSWSGNLSRSKDIQDVDEEPLVQVRARKRLSKLPTGPASNALNSRKEIVRRKPIIYRDEEILAALPNRRSPFQQRQALRALPTNVVANKSGLRERAKRRVSSFNKKVKKTIDIWRADADV